MYLRRAEIGQLAIIAFLLLNIAECRISQYADSHLMTLLRAKRFDFHMFGCGCRPVMDCTRDRDCEQSKGPDYVCGFRCCSFTCIHVSNTNDEVDYGAGADDTIDDDVDINVSAGADANADDIVDAGGGSGADADVIYDANFDNNVTADADIDTSSDHNITDASGGNEKHYTIDGNNTEVVDNPDETDALKNSKVPNDVFDVNIMIQDSDSVSDVDNEPEEENNVVKNDKEVITSDRIDDEYEYTVNINEETKDRLHKTSTKNDIDEYVYSHKTTGYAGGNVYKHITKNSNNNMGEHFDKHKTKNAKEEKVYKHITNNSTYKLGPTNNKNNDT